MSSSIDSSRQKIFSGVFVHKRILLLWCRASYGNKLYPSTLMGRVEMKTMRNIQVRRLVRLTSSTRPIQAFSSRFFSNDTDGATKGPANKSPSDKHHSTTTDANNKVIAAHNAATCPTDSTRQQAAQVASTATNTYVFPTAKRGPVDPVFAKTDFRKIMGDSLQKPAGALWNAPSFISRALSNSNPPSDGDGGDNKVGSGKNEMNEHDNNNSDDIGGVEVTEVEDEPDNGSISSIGSSSGDTLASTPRTASPNFATSRIDPIYAKTDFRKLMGKSLQKPAGPLWHADTIHSDDDEHEVDAYDYSVGDRQFIPQVPLHGSDGRVRKRVLILCTGGTLTMAPDHRGALAPVEGALSDYMSHMNELQTPGMPEVVLHEYAPFYDSSDLGPADWARIAQDIRSNYLHFDGFVVLTGTDTMAYCATALSFMLENLGKPVVFTGSQIPLSEPYNDARRNLIMALIFASRDTINEVTIFFHDRLLRACRATKVNTHRLMAFDSPNLDPLATIGISIDENEHLILPPAKGALRVHKRVDTRLLTLRLVPGFDDEVMREMLERSLESHSLRCLVLQLYGTGNIPSVKQSLIQLLADASDKGLLVVAATQCHTGSVRMGHYAVGKALEEAGVVSASDMTLEAIACKVGYLFGRGDLTREEVGSLMGVSLRGEMTPVEALSLPPLATAYQRGVRKGKKYY